MKLLIVEDNPSLAEDMINFLSENDFLVEYVSTLKDAYASTEIYEYDLLIVDIGLPDGSGLDLIKTLKENEKQCGILIVTAKNSVDDKVQGLELGADDYITKPFHSAELNARIKSILRRNKFNGSNTVKVNELTIDINATEAFVHEKMLVLTKKEYDLLLYFIYNKSRVLTKENIAEHLWGDHVDQADNFDFIYNHIKNLRKKIISAGGDNYIRSVYGMGYKFIDS